MLGKHGVDFMLGCEVARIRFSQPLVNVLNLPGLTLNIGFKRLSDKKGLGAQGGAGQLVELRYQRLWQAKVQGGGFVRHDFLHM